MKVEHNRCPHCGQVIDKREIALFKGMYEALAIAYDWCQGHKTYRFKTKDIRDMIGKNEYARFGDWVYFSGMVFKEEKGHYGLNMERVSEFLFKDKVITIAGWKDPLTGQFTPSRYGSKRQIPGLQEFLDSKQMYESRYTGAQLILG
jgi:hypothetical protein